MSARVRSKRRSPIPIISPLHDKMRRYWMWHGICHSFSTLKKELRTEKKRGTTIGDMHRLYYLVKQIIFHYFKNFFHFPFFLFTFLTPSYMKGNVTVWTNLKTIFRKKEFHPLRMAVLSQLCFVFIFVQFSIVVVRYYSSSLYTATYAFIQTSWVGNASTSAFATHASDQTGWNKFYSTSSIDVNTSVAGEVSLSPSLNSTSQTSDTDFNTWTKASNLATSSTGSSGRIVLLKPDGASCTQASQCSGGGCNGSNQCYTPPCAGATSLLYSGITYSLVEINTQCWFSQNLNVGTMLAAGTTLPSNDSLIEKWCYNNDTANCTTYGGLYTWAEANQFAPGCNTTSCTASSTPNQGICPSGWHFPTDAEIKTLEVYLGMCTGAGVGCVDATGNRGTNQGTQLKSGGASGFNAIFAGNRNTDGSFANVGAVGYLWSASESSASNAWNRIFQPSEARVYRDVYAKTRGFSVRCLKD